MRPEPLEAETAHEWHKGKLRIAQKTQPATTIGVRRVELAIPAR
jgi:hypothetical protein